jgi:two-component system response regulator AtoC
VKLLPLAANDESGPLYGAAMAALWQAMLRVAPTMLSVLLLGETGVGKERFAETIHLHSRRATRPMLRLNCAGLGEAMLESELFGFERGAFTGAVATKPGLLQSVDGGTVFLDEVAELPPAVQAKLLRVLEDRTVRRVGALREQVIDVRFIAATNRPLLDAVEAGAFRRDLYYRLAGATFALPPLRDRVDEIDALVERFVGSACAELGRGRARVSAAAMALLRTHRWPGNIRELRNVIESAVVRCEGEILGVELLPSECRTASPAVIATSPDDATVDARLDAIVAALTETAGNQTQAARLLGISRGTLVKRISGYALPRPRKRAPK